MRFKSNFSDIAAEAVAKCSKYIKGEVLADSLVLADVLTINKTELNDKVALGIEVCLN